MGAGRIAVTMVTTYIFRAGFGLTQFTETVPRAQWPLCACPGLHPGLAISGVLISPVPASTPAAR